ncbi:MAG: hypothetical protein K2Y30_04135 [Flavobacteriaceae bacterium]|nr:hypothetical protein [Flavobacteriaceae bacterium]
MKTTITITRYFGLFILLIGILLNLKMYFLDEPGTLVYLLLCFFGIILFGLSYLMKISK